MAYLPKAVVSAKLDGYAFDPYSAQTITNSDQFLDALRQVLDSQVSLRWFPLSQFHQFFPKGFGWCSPSQALSGRAVQAVTNRLHIST